ncbi:MAG: hypothetical protein A3K12_01145 [Candidatus Rokubacteria bacterium RIFCSPLOWO2_12_FULL_71_19]|nr:MAG: hypothetical protein A3K12_01145 [Candidatus Rokubacteria bacterium RIFCSPLOWO2_12_FULL_71_19]
MDKADLWKRFQAHMGYTDAEMAVFRSDPLKVKMVTESPEFVKSRIVAEVIESHGCHTHHTVGQKFVMDGNGQMITRECPEKMCIFALAALESPVNQIYERFIAHSDPNNERTMVVQCSDVGLDKGGWGKILMKVSVERVK